MKPLFDKLYEKYHQDLFQYIFYMIKDRELTEDLVQEVYIRIIRSYTTFRGKSSEKTWIFSIARHVTIDYIRKQQRKRKRIMDFFDWGEKGEQLQSQQSLPDEIAIEKEEMQEVYQTLDQCTVDQKNVIILRFIQGMSIQETAEILKWSESKVKTTQHRGIKSLKDRMKKKREGGIQREA